MNITENLLATIAEECAEIQAECNEVQKQCADIQKTISKAMRFGLNNHHPDTPQIANGHQIVKEFTELFALVTHMQNKGLLPQITDDYTKEIMLDKIKRVAKWQEISFSEGTLKK
ncbi:hypothetical protein M2146_002509 [Lachnospiraceae bacterium PF1-22]